MAQPRDKNPAFEKLLSRSLHAGRDAVVSSCPDPALLAAYYERSLFAEETSLFDSHLSSCFHCQSQLAALARSDESISSSPERRFPPFAWLVNWRFLAPAAAAALALVVWVAMRPVPVSVNDTIAMTQPPAPPISKPPPQPSADLPAPQSKPTPTSRISPKDENARPAQMQPPKSPSTAAPSPILAGKISAPLVAEEKEGRASGIVTPAEREKLLADQAAPQSGVRSAEESQNRTYRAVDPLQSRRQDAPSPPAPPARSVSQQAVVLEPKQKSENRVAQLADEKARTKNETDRANRESTVSSADSMLGLAATAKRKAAVLSPAPENYFAPSRKVIWRILPAGKIERSRDEGKTWVTLDTSAGVNLLAASAPADDICWVVGAAGAVLRTTDAEHWEKLSSPTTENLVSVTAVNATTAVVTDSSARIYATSDAGRTWKRK